VTLSSALHPAAFLRAERAALLFATLSGLALCCLPLVGSIGPESALVLSLLLSPWAAACGARFAIAARGKVTRSTGLLARAVGHAWLLLLIPLLLLSLNALRVKTCEPFSGLAFMALGPWASLSLAAIVGVAMTVLVQSSWLATTLAVLVPFVAIAGALWDFVSSPGIYAMGHFFGYFPGTLYDRRVDVPDAWLSHRLLSVVIAAGLWAFVHATRHARTGRFAPVRVKKHPLLVAQLLLLAAFACAMAVKSHELGHTTSRSYVESKLGLAVMGPRCRAVVPREMHVEEAQRIAEDCEFRISQVEHTLGVREPRRITAFFFRSANEKRALMGAARVYIAKPWRREVYLQNDGFPHEVLAHELAHVVARNAASGPFGVPGHLGGLIPEPTLVEGMAVALEPAPREELTPHQWAKAAHRAGVAPKLSSLLGPNFFGTNQALAYTLAGSFLGFVLETQGNAQLRRVYRMGDVERALGKPFAELEKSWLGWLENIPLPEPAAALAKQRFERPGVFSQVCPHALERLAQELSAALSSGDLERAVGKCRDVLAIDPHDTGTRATLAGTLARIGDARAADQELASLIGPPAAPRPTIAHARTSMADARFMRGDFTGAEHAYRALLDEPQSEGELRQLEVRLLALEAGEPTRHLLGELLIGGPMASVGGPDPRTAMHLIHALYPARNDGLAHYLEARQLAGADRHDLAHPLLREAILRGLPTRRLRVEALRLRALSAFVIGAYDDARASQEQIAALPDVSLADTIEARDFIARVDFRRAGVTAKPSGTP
jgi:hypothetical protein